MASIFRRTVRGMRDLLPKEAELMRRVEQTARDLARTFGYSEVITPVMEHYELLAAKIGEEIRERMYVFEDLAGRKVALRPEFTASIARLLATKMMYNPKPIRLFCTGSLYRYDEPQFGRYREFWQANYELIGSDRPDADAEILVLTDDFMKRLGIRDYYFKMGHVGILRGILGEEGIEEAQQNSIMQLLDKKQSSEALEIVRSLGGSRKCQETLKRLLETRGSNPSQVVKEIRSIVKDYGSADEATENLESILSLMDEGAANFKLLIEAGFARGLEYYTGMIFEVYAPEIDVALCGGGRYDNLIELFGGEHTPAVGVALGIDRITLVVDKQGTFSKLQPLKRILVVPVVDKVRGKAFEIASKLRESGVCTEIEVMGRTVSKALSDASRRGITHVVIVGPKELEEGRVVLRDMERKEQKTISVEDVLGELRETG
ncbi:MAG: histidine--tRNA ligase [Candidatus Bathyarchaeia archaeon]